MLPLVALTVAVVYLLVLAAVAVVLVRRRAALPAGSRPSAAPLWWLLIGGVLFAPVVWALATVTVGLVADVVAGDWS